MSTVTTVADPEQVESATQTRIDATDASVHEVRSFVRRTDCEAHLERRGGRTDLVVDSE